MTQRIPVAMVGCGAVAVMQHLPALVGRDDCEITAVVDRNRDRAVEVAGRFGVPHILDDHRQVTPELARAAVVAVPNHLHEPVTVDLGRAGVHVLVEKPMAPTVAACDAMIEAAAAAGVVLAVGLFQRFSHPARLVKRVITGGELGRIRSYEIESGVEFAWPVASDYVLRREAAGGGVLMDLGSHSIDQILWWFGDVERLSFRDDSRGGLEADCVLEATHSSGVTGRLEVSRSRQLRQLATIRGELGDLEIGLFSNDVTLRLPDGSTMHGQAGSERAPAGAQGVFEFTVAEQDDFLASVRTGRAPTVPGEEGRRSIALIEACYRQRQPLALPWELPLTASEVG